MYSWFPNLSQISLKNSFGKVVFQILAEIEMSRNENRLFGRQFETVHILHFFLWNMVVISVYIYDVKIIKKFRWESGFLNGSAGYLMQLSVNMVKLKVRMHKRVRPGQKLSYTWRTSQKLDLV